jgi:hypothetical protein
MRVARLAALFLCLAGSAQVEAKPSRIADEFRDDRYSFTLAQGMSGEDVARVMRCPAPLRRDCRGPGKAKKKLHRHERAKVAARAGAVIVPLPRVRPEMDMDDEQAAAYRAIAALLAGGKVYVRPAALPASSPRPRRQTLLGGLAREIGAAFGVPHRFVRGRLICAANVNAALAERGIRGTGSRLAKSFLHWGRSSRPVPGAIAVFNRGRNPRSGHVAIVHSVKPNGTVIYLNPSASRQRWVVGPYRRKPISYRIAA